MFKNDTLGIESSWNYASGARAIPDLKFIPSTVKKILTPIAKERGAVLFATWGPNRKKYLHEGFVEVRREDVRYVDSLNPPFYIIVLVNEHPFKGDTSKYLPQAKTMITSSPCLKVCPGRLKIIIG